MTVRNSTWSTVFDRSLAVREGRVRFPRRGAVTCAGCPYLLGLEGDERTRVVCAWPYDVERRVRRELAGGRRWSRSRQRRAR